MRGYELYPRAAADFWRLAGGFWRGPTATRAWLLTGALAVCLALSTATTVCLNRWQRLFFDALERHDATTAVWLVVVFLVIVAVMAAIGVGIVRARESLQVHWRAFLVGRLVGTWIGDNRFYRLAATHAEPDNPEYRISDDSRWATEPLVDLSIGAFSAVMGAAAFIAILWSVGGDYRLAIGGTELQIPAYMVLVALAYGAAASGLMLWIGRALVGCVAAKNAAEGAFRFALMRVRENAESVALMGGAEAEQRRLAGFYDTVVARWIAIVRQHGYLTWVTNASGPMIPIVPLLFAAPKYFAGELSLGEVVQIAAAFVQVQLAISWIVDNYTRLAEWFASARRVLDMVEAADGLDRRTAKLGRRRILLRTSEDEHIRIEGLAVADVAGGILVEAGRFDVEPGQRVHIHGPTSAGKTTLARAMAGLWPWGRGVIELPAGARLMVIPQKPYLPIGTLRQALLYPDPTLDPDKTAGDVRQALADTGLAHLGARLDDTERWDQVLGNGERQRLCIARALIHRPDIVVIDDALAALDEAAQGELEALLLARLAGITLISLSQRQQHATSGLGRYALERSATSAAIRALAPAAA